MNYSKAESMLTGRNKESRKLANHTYLKRRAEDFAVQLHETDVVTIKADGTFILDSGGWQTLTTKDRINGYSPAMISQRQGIWYLPDGSLFYDGMVVGSDGQPLNPKQPESYEKKLKEIKAQVSGYAKAFAEQAPGMSIPGGGDCWFCVMYDNKTRRTWGDISGDNDHLRNHIQEKYYVPALLFNAIKEKGYVEPGYIYQLATSEEGYWNTRKLIYEYMLKRLKGSLDKKGATSGKVASSNNS